MLATEIAVLAWNTSLQDAECLRNISYLLLGKAGSESDMKELMIPKVSLHWLDEKNQIPHSKGFNDTFPLAPRIHKNEVRMDTEYVRLVPHHLTKW